MKNFPLLLMTVITILSTPSLACDNSNPTDGSVSRDIITDEQPAELHNASHTTRTKGSDDSGDHQEQLSPEIPGEEVDAIANG